MSRGWDLGSRVVTAFAEATKVIQTRSEAAAVQTTQLSVIVLDTCQSSRHGQKPFLNQCEEPNKNPHIQFHLFSEMLQRRCCHLFF